MGMTVKSIGNMGKDCPYVLQPLVETALTEERWRRKPYSVFHSLSEEACFLLRWWFTHCIAFSGGLLGRFGFKEK